MSFSDALAWTLVSVIMTWVWCAFRNVTTNICNVSQPVAPLIVSWSVIALGVLVGIVSTFLRIHCWRVIVLFHFQLVHVILIVLMAAKDAKTQFASAMWVRIINNLIKSYLRMTRMMITWMLVWIRQAKLLVNVFWIVMMIVAAKLIVYRPLKMNTRSALVRFLKLNKFLSHTIS